jgi:hypothetical protein
MKTDTYLWQCACSALGDSPTTIVLAQMQVPSGLSIASVNVSQDPITSGSDQEVSVAVVDNSAADAPAAV